MRRPPGAATPECSSDGTRRARVNSVDFRPAGVWGLCDKPRRETYCARDLFKEEWPANHVFETLVLTRHAEKLEDAVISSQDEARHAVAASSVQTYMADLLRAFQGVVDRRQI